MNGWRWVRRQSANKERRQRNRRFALMQGWRDLDCTGEISNRRARKSSYGEIYLPELGHVLRRPCTRSISEE